MYFAKDHTWVDSRCYYVLKQRGARIQALPLFLVQFKESAGEFVERLGAIQSHDTEATSLLAARQRGGLVGCVARRTPIRSCPFTRWTTSLSDLASGAARRSSSHDVLAGARSVQFVSPPRAKTPLELCTF